MSITISRALRFAFAFALVLSISTDALAQLSLGKVSGVVVDSATREPLPAASVRIEGTVLGAMANDMGEYFILNVPPGNYAVVVNVIGYVPVRAIGTEVHADLTTTLNFELESNDSRVRRSRRGRGDAGPGREESHLHPDDRGGRGNSVAAGR